ncbi:MAG: hypothetical protein O3A46_12320 [Candidatus Poribacteria bacterium]|nr:hypothetical protein [Candidatus Poribacteria bacterium]
MTPDILLVEDSATDVELIMFALRQEGAEGRVCVARDGAQASRATAPKRGKRWCRMWNRLE